MAARKYVAVPAALQHVLCMNIMINAMTSGFFGIIGLRLVLDHD